MSRLGHAVYQVHIENKKSGRWRDFFKFCNYVSKIVTITGTVGLGYNVYDYATNEDYARTRLGSTSTMVSALCLVLGYVASKKNKARSDEWGSRSSELDSELKRMSADFLEECREITWCSNLGHETVDQLRLGSRLGYLDEEEVRLIIQAQPSALEQALERRKSRSSSS